MFMVKQKVDGFIGWYKARLVAKRIIDVCLDYRGTFAPVAKNISIQVLLSLSINENDLFMNWT